MVNMGFRRSGCEREVIFSQHVFSKHFHRQLSEINFLPFGNVNIVILMFFQTQRANRYFLCELDLFD